MRPPRIHLLRLVPPVLVLAGCFPYVPNEGPPPPPGSSVRVRLARPQSFELLGFTVHDVQRVDGTLVRERSGELEVSADWVLASASGRFDGGGRMVSLTPADIEAVEVRKHSWLRTGIVTVLGSVAIYAAMQAFQGSSASSTGGGGGGNEPR